MSLVQSVRVTPIDYEELPELIEDTGSDTSSPPSSPTLDHRPLPLPALDSWTKLDAEIRAEAATPWGDDWDVEPCHFTTLVPASPSPPRHIAIDLIRLELFPIVLLEQIQPPRTAVAPWSSTVLAEFPRPAWYRMTFKSPSARRIARAMADRRMTIWDRPAAHGRFLRVVATIAEE